MELRQYQIDACNSTHGEWDDGRHKTVVNLPTGTGKTIVMGKIADDEVNKGGRVLVLAHREELLTQASDKIRKLTGRETILEKAESRSFGSFIPITVASVQSIAQEKRLIQFPQDYFSTVIVDEAHHSLSDTYQRVLKHFEGADVLGLTATPDRGDKRNLGEYYDSMAYEYSMSQAIKDGYLVPVKAQMIPLELDLANVKVSNGDYSAGDIGCALEPYLEQIAEEMVHYCKERQRTLVFLPLVETSQKFCRMLQAKGIKAAEVNGNSTDRQQILKDFEDGKYQVLCNSMLLTEGYDNPAVDCVVVLRPTRVRGIYQQMVGRGTRLYPGKKDLLILDFLWLSERHDLCRPSSLVSKDAKIAEKIDKQVEDNDGEVDILQAEEDAERDVLQEREEALARELEAMRKRKRQLVDPLQYALSISAEDLTNYAPTFAWEMGPASKAQLEFLERRGIFPETVENCGMASLLIDRLKRRQEEGLATPKQIRCLERFGFRRVGTWQFEAASKMISLLAGNSWRVPYGMQPALYTP
ncbi:MAG: DEAD/DEAH box helicase [Butyrivibrio sp.]|nr:DEAD/DEAH box helicase [Butyrivibrio sp.]